VVGGPLGHVGRGQPRDHPGSLGELHEGIDAGHRGQHVGVGELHALGGSGGAGGVDQGEDVPRLYGGHGGGDVEVGRRALHLVKREHAGRELLSRLGVDQDQVLETGQAVAGFQHLRQVLALDQGYPRAGVGHHELDLVGGVGLVDRERGPPQHHHRQVGDVKLRAV